MKRRIEPGGRHLYTEFSYLMLQSLRLPDALRPLRLHPADGRQRPVGQHHRRHAISIRKLRGARAHGLVMPLVTTVVGREVRQDRGRRRLARPAADLALPLLPVLAQHRRPRRREVPQVLHLPRPRRDRGPRGRRGVGAGAPRRAARAGARGDAHHPRAGGGGPRRARVGAAVRRAHQRAGRGRHHRGVRRCAIDRDGGRAVRGAGHERSRTCMVATTLASSKGEAMRLVTRRRRVREQPARHRRTGPADGGRGHRGADVRAAQGLAPVSPGAPRVGRAGSEVVVSRCGPICGA
ncbi:MAG: hypothetical protein MZV64_04695 [Ignavibacteriales bacterium]|nr:hypothetical protein [Ignavibacteriales bacterium]